MKVNLSALFLIASITIGNTMPLDAIMYSAKEYIDGSQSYEQQPDRSIVGAKMSSTCIIRIQRGSGEGALLAFGTGVLIAEDVVITARHLWDKFGEYF